MRALYVCNVTNVLMAMMQIRRFVNPNEGADILLTDYSGNMASICENLKETGLFDNIYFYRIKKTYQGGNLFHRIRKFFYILEKEDLFLKKSGLGNLDYDIVYYNNFDLLSNQIYRYIFGKNSDASFCRVEEGFSTYTVYNSFKMLEKLTRILFKWFHIPPLQEATDKIFLYEPDLLLYDCSYEKIEIPKYSKERRGDVELLNQVFGYTNEAEEYEKYKYIIFEESFYQDGREKINDEEIFRAIVEFVGADNTIIKLHPRNDKNRFRDLNVGDGKIPWEIIQLNGNFSDSVFLTISSGAVLASKLWLEDHVKTIFLYQCANRKPDVVNENYLRYFRALNERDHTDHWFVPEDMEEVISILEVSMSVYED